MSLGRIEQFVYAAEELRQYVVYGYYDIEGNLLYIGMSKNFYHAHYFNSQRLPFFENVMYVGFVFCDSEETMKTARKYYKKQSQELRGDIDILTEREAMEEFWEHLLS